MFIHITQSNTLVRLVLGTHLGAIAIALLLPVHFGLRIGLAGLAAASLGGLMRRHALAPAGSLQFDDDGHCRCTLLPDVEPQHYRVAAADCHPGFVRLVLARPGRRHATLLVMRDALEADDYRALRARIHQQRLALRGAQSRP